MDNLIPLLEKFSSKKVLVIGDVMLDENWLGDAARLSPEAPVPVLKVKEKTYEPGGAANVAANISSLQGQVSLFGFIGEDIAGAILKQILEHRKIKHFFQVNKITTHKLRGKVKNQQISRLDFEETELKYFNQEFLDKLKNEINNSDIILVSDYAKGAITRELMDFLISTGKPVIVDPKQANPEIYKGIFLITPNEKETKEMTKESDVSKAAEILRNSLGCNVLVTRGEKGMLLVSKKSGIFDIPTYAKEVYDVTGAGDTAISAIALALASNASLEEAAILANHAAGIKVSHQGTYNVKLNELKQEIFGEEKKVYSNIQEIIPLIESLKSRSKKIIWTNGCFDILHEGHVRYLKKAAECGDFLLVGMNSDESIKRIKGPTRPVRNEQARAEILSSLAFVDAVLIFQDDDTTSYLNALKPDIYVKGGDYNIDTINQPERKIVESYGGEIVIIPKEIDISTTKILEKLKDGRD